LNVVFSKSGLAQLGQGADVLFGSALADSQQMDVVGAAMDAACSLGNTVLKGKVACFESFPTRATGRAGRCGLDHGLSDVGSMGVVDGYC